MKSNSKCDEVDQALLGLNKKYSSSKKCATTD